jgi:XTP/dITP diphosphohydrolase
MALADHLLRAAPEHGLVVWLSDPDGEPELSSALAARLVGGESVDVEVLAGSYDLPGAHLVDLVEVMDRLRSPGGCPWDAQQTHESLLPYLVEEAYEVVEAVETGDLAHLREELGDLALQIAFHARIAAEDPEHGFTIDDVVDGIVTKLVRRHPHVFGDDEVPGGAEGAAHVAGRWEEIKAAEKSRTSVLDGIPPSLPALAYAAKVVSRASRLQVAPTASDDELGDALLALVADAVRNGADPEAALRRATRRFAAAVVEAESIQSPRSTITVEED